MTGNLIKKYLDDNGIKYSFVANAAGMPLNVFSAMLNCKRKITVEEYFVICSILKVEANYFANIIRSGRTNEPRETEKTA